MKSMLETKFDEVEHNAPSGERNPTYRQRRIMPRLTAEIAQLPSYVHERLLLSPAWAVTSGSDCTYYIYSDYSSKVFYSSSAAGHISADVKIILVYSRIFCLPPRYIYLSGLRSGLLGARLAS